MRSQLRGGGSQLLGDLVCYLPTTTSSQGKQSFHSRHPSTQVGHLRSQLRGGGGGGVTITGGSSLLPSDNHLLTGETEFSLSSPINAGRSFEVTITGGGSQLLGDLVCYLPTTTSSQGKQSFHSRHPSTQVGRLRSQLRGGGGGGSQLLGDLVCYLPTTTS